MVHERDCRTDRLPSTYQDAFLAFLDDLEHRSLHHCRVTTMIELHVKKHRGNGVIVRSDLVPLPLNVSRKIALRAFEPRIFSPRLLVVHLGEHDAIHPGGRTREDAALEMTTEKVGILATLDNIFLRARQEPVHRLPLAVL